ncbi:tRNA (cmo5U34)-methyltransferase [Stieleria neptunia]|uniref:Carboxy-S-adenosyl-L-methionine synthase n=1 Tax=Stieleria neptunia TaxID=2527979 RepID=A0A518HQ58_9BACT|nr:carboxy-S-adenosyl-L-methionine synthase CmoA [Stieleria neptunia]QDV42927.1 tRNA (cmo5U34)-methyltransferase [Stieleria neptunia]
MSRDNLYSLPRDRVGQFQFDADVADVFPDMISRSVPGYASILSVIEQLAGRFVRPATNVYDLGCSLGAATLLIRNQAPPSATLHAVDNSSAMIDRLRKRLDQQSARPDACGIELHLADVCDVNLSNASMIVLNFTLQFVPAAQRRRLLQTCFDALVPGGGLLLSEKVCFEDPGQQSLLTELHLDFKRACGYSELEIAQKRTSLENTLIPESIPTHTDRLKEIGFGVVAPWFQCFNFASILAVKSAPS